MRTARITDDQCYRLRIHAHQVRLTAQQLRWQAAQVRRRIHQVQLARHMPDANPLTREVSADILIQHGL